MISNVPDVFLQGVKRPTTGRGIFPTEIPTGANEVKCSPIPHNLPIFSRNLMSPPLNHLRGSAPLGLLCRTYAYSIEKPKRSTLMVVFVLPILEGGWLCIGKQ
jgi:hypothetical protein